MRRRVPLLLALGLLGVYLALTALAEYLELQLRPLQPVSLAAPPVFLAFPITGLIITSRRPENAIGWVLSWIGPLILLLLVAPRYAEYALVTHHGQLAAGELAAWMTTWVWAPFLVLTVMVLPSLFPTGRFLTPRWSWTGLAGVAFLLTAGVANALMPGTAVDGYPSIHNPLGITSGRPALEAILGVSAIPLFGGMLGTIASLAVRYRRAAQQEREQLKWFFFAAVLATLPFVVHDINQNLSNVLFISCIPLLPISIAIAILKYRLYDIDVLISRTIVYGFLAAFITGIYVAVVVGIASLIGSSGRANLGLSILATAIVAVAFQPLRERVQNVANRLVYGKRASPYQVLAAFSESVAESYDGEVVLGRMASILADATGAEQAEVWLRSGTALRPAACWPPEGPRPSETVAVSGDSLPELPHSDRAVAVRHQSELLGALTVLKRRGETLTPIEEGLLDDLATQAGIVLRNVRLTLELVQRLEELRTSRQRLVAAQDTARRRLERNLHDGAQQNVVALKVKLGLAEIFADRDPSRVAQLLSEVRSDTDTALETLRDLARGVYPRLLAQQGLIASLEAESRKAPLPVTVDADGVSRYPQEVEAAVYFSCLEALQNISKYAQATQAHLRLRGSGDQLSFSVEDDGKGFDLSTVSRGAGLQNIADRLDALGGRMSVRSGSGQGTCLTGVVPLHAMAAAG